MKGNLKIVLPLVLFSIAMGARVSAQQPEPKPSALGSVPEKPVPSDPIAPAPSNDPTAKPPPTAEAPRAIGEPSGPKTPPPTPGPAPLNVDPEQKRRKKVIVEQPTTLDVKVSADADSKVRVSKGPGSVVQRILRETQLKVAVRQYEQALTEMRDQEKALGEISLSGKANESPVERKAMENKLKFLSNWKDRMAEEIRDLVGTSEENGRLKTSESVKSQMDVMSVNSVLEAKLAELERVERDALAQCDALVMQLNKANRDRDQALINSQRAVAEAQLKAAEGEFLRAQTLKEKQVISEGEFEEARAKLALQKAQMARDLAEAERQEVKHAELELSRINDLHSAGRIPDTELSHAKQRLEAVRAEIAGAPDEKRNPPNKAEIDRNAKRETLLNEQHANKDKLRNVLQEEMKMAEAELRTTEMRVKQGASTSEEMIRAQENIIEIRRELAELEGNKELLHDLYDAQLKLLEELEKNVQKRFEAGMASSEDRYRIRREILELKRKELKSH